MKVLFVNAGERTCWEEKIDDERIKGVLDLGIYLHLERYKSYSKDAFSPENVLVCGTGTWNYPGTQRAVFVFRSPLHGGVHASTMGDFGEYIKRAGYSAVVIEGKSERGVFVAIKNSEVKFIDSELPQNVFIKERELYAKLHEFYRDSPFRLSLCGAGAEATKYGCLVSSKHGRIGTIPDVAGRGGAGSVLYRAHGVTGIALGGNERVEIQLDAELVRRQIETTKKYREKGTFAANYPHLKENTIFMNWSGFLLSREKRAEMFSKYIEGELLRDYTFSSETCGERCVAACKKYESKVKIDYEPAQALGPFIGIFNRTYIKDLLHTVDSFGIDAIYFGNAVASVFEALSAERIPKDMFGLEEIPSMDFGRVDSERNFMLAKYLAEKLMSGEISILGENLRIIGRELGIEDFCLYVPHGSEFDMTPNFYWSLGLILPVVMHGKYFSDYHTVVKPPEEYASICAERTLKEYAIDNLGICRFHRGWAENLLSESDLESCRYWIGMLWKYKKKADALPKFWESKRTVEVVKALFNEHGEGEWKNVDEEKIREYWERWQSRYAAILNLER